MNDTEKKLLKAIFGDTPLKKTDCETCKLLQECEKINGEGNINGCLIS